MRALHRCVWVVGATALLLVFTTTSAHAIPWPVVNPIPPPQNGAGSVNVSIKNNSAATAPQFSLSTKQDSNCPQNDWANSTGFAQDYTTPALDPGETGEVQMTTTVCNGEIGTLMPYDDDGAFSIGVTQASAFKFATDWSMNGDFKDFHWEGGYVGDGNTAYFVMVDCSDTSTIIGNGSQGPNVSTKFTNGSTICFSYE